MNGFPYVLKTFLSEQLSSSFLISRLVLLAGDCGVTSVVTLASEMILRSRLAL